MTRTPRPGRHEQPEEEEPERRDLRVPALGGAAWIGGLLAALTDWRVVLVTGACGLGIAGWRRSRTLATCVLILLAVAAAGLLRAHQVAGDPVARLAADRAVATAEVVITSDPRRVASSFDETWLLRASVRRISGRGATHQLRSPVLLLAGPEWGRVRLGARVRVTARLATPRSGDVAAVVTPVGGPVELAAPDVWWRGAAAVRGSLRDSVAHLPVRPRALVPALVDGDDASVGPGLAEQFRATGLTHLLAVSGTNLTLVVGFLLLTGRWCGVRGRGHYVVGAIGIVGFVLLARTEPSVVRAAAMGTVALIGMGVDGRHRGPRALGLALVALLLLDPRLAVTVGFALSVVATAGILLLAPGLRDALAGWLPRWLAEAISVPLAAQLACTPIVAAISGQVSVVAVGANLVVSPVIGPATVLGLAGGLVGLVWDPAGRVLGTLAGGCVSWLVTVAQRGSALPTAAVDWDTGVAPLTALTALVLVLALVLPRLLRTAPGGLGCACLLVVVVVVRPPTPGWPPPDWVLVVCDVGQGDAIALRTGPGSAIVVDTGPEPVAVDRCLDRLAVSRVPLLVLTHDHADHVDGVPGVRDGRAVALTETSADATYGATRVFGEATVQVLWPPPGIHAENPNDRSVVLLAEVSGVRVLLTGDVEPPSQAGLARAWPDLAVDVLKVPHHGSRHQDLDWLGSLGARVALISAGADNDYGHPSPDTLRPLGQAGLEVLRTDTDGDLAVTVEDGRLGVATGG